MPSKAPSATNLHEFYTPVLLSGTAQNRQERLLQNFIFNPVDMSVPPIIKRYLFLKKTII
jgi:hypothetical protein